MGRRLRRLLRVRLEAGLSSSWCRVLGREVDHLREKGVSSTMDWRASGRFGYSLDSRAVGGCLCLVLGILGMRFRRRLLLVGYLWEV